MSQWQAFDAGNHHNHDDFMEEYFWHSENNTSPHNTQLNYPWDKTLWEKKKMLEVSIFSFSNTIFSPIRGKFIIGAKYKVSSPLTLSQTSPGFYVSAVQVFWKHWKNKKLLLMTIHHFPTVFSSHLENFMPFSSNLRLLSANSFSLGDSKIWHLGKGGQYP